MGDVARYIVLRVPPAHAVRLVAMVASVGIVDGGRRVRPAFFSVPERDRRAVDFDASPF